MHWLRVLLDIVRALFPSRPAINVDQVITLSFTRAELESLAHVMMTMAAPLSQDAQHKQIYHKVLEAGAGITRAVIPDLNNPDTMIPEHESVELSNTVGDWWFWKQIINGYLSLNGQLSEALIRADEKIQAIVPADLASEQSIAAPRHPGTAELAERKAQIGIQLTGPELAALSEKLDDLRQLAASIQQRQWLQVLDDVAPVLDKARRCGDSQDYVTVELSALSWGQLAYMLVPSVARPDSESGLLSVRNTPAPLRSTHAKIMAALPQSLKQPTDEQLVNYAKKYQAGS
jgi:hypothetical protein